MVDRDDCRIALLPIKPRFVNSILAGRKKVEFRRRFPADVEYVVIYSSNPVKRVVAFFRVGKIFRRGPQQIWRKYHQIGGISHVDFTAYYAGTQQAVAIEVDELFVLRAPLALTDLDLPPRAPQNFCYVEATVLDRLLSSASPASNSVN